jgi:hypothetical protein
MKGWEKSGSKEPMTVRGHMYFLGLREEVKKWANEKVLGTPAHFYPAYSSQVGMFVMD